MKFSFSSKRSAGKASPLNFAGPIYFDRKHDKSNICNRVGRARSSAGIMVGACRTARFPVVQKQALLERFRLAR